MKKYIMYSSLILNITSIYLIYMWDHILFNNNYFKYIFVNINPLKNSMYNIVDNWSSNILIYFWLDQISILFILITTFLIPIAILSNWNTKFKASFNTFLFLILLIEFNAILIFYTLDLFLFYVFFEFMTMPTFFLIYVFGSNLTKIRASLLFLIYSLTSSTFLSMSIASLMFYYKTTSILNLNISLNINKISDNSILYIDNNIIRLLFIFLFLGFAIKIPLTPFHIWLPEAHWESPTGVSIILAGIILKIGGYALLRYISFNTSLYINSYMNIVYLFCVLSILYITYMCIRQQNIKQLIAYSSVNHMGISTLGLMSGVKTGIIGGLYSMIQHSLLASWFFYLAGNIYEKFHTYNINKISNYVIKPNVLSFVLFLLILINTSLPFTISFLGELYIIKSFIVHNNFIFYILLFNIIFTAYYSFWLFIRLFYSTKNINSSNLIINNNWLSFDLINYILLFLLIFLSFLFGFFPNILINFINI